MLSNDELLTLFHSILDAKEHGETLREHISDENIRVIENYIDFFRDIPKCDLKEVLEDFMVLVFRYERDVSYQNHRNMMNNLQKFEETKNAFDMFEPKSSKKKRPITQLDQDVKVLKKCKDVLKKLLDVKVGKQGKEVILFATSKNSNPYREQLPSIYQGIKKIIDDLENEKFELFYRSKYYKDDEPSKVEIKKFLKDTKEKYNLKKVSDSQRDLGVSIFT
ncbi:MAG: Unknown protein [uncultured Sulfurovum sp.]|uniref:Uncharacterized protein n=1 Tax=uncultured Sulfurovum sp. TaxID=269237 RepID=A0A6S6U3M5_9BACT|nr:MAG: Unknown protein [uncultured Sulfurovum sp.]